MRSFAPGQPRKGWNALTVGKGAESTRRPSEGHCGPRRRAAPLAKAQNIAPESFGQAALKFRISPIRMLLGADRHAVALHVVSHVGWWAFLATIVGAACVWYTLHRHQQEARAPCPRPAVRCIWASSSSAPAITWPAGATTAPSTTHMELPVMQEIARIAERGKIRPAVHLRLDGDGSHRPSLVPVPLRTDHPDHRARRLHHACRSRRHGLDQLFRAVQRRPHLRLDRPHQRRARRHGTSSPAPTPRRRSTSIWTSTSSTSCAMRAPTSSSMSSAGCGTAGRTARSSPTRPPAGTSMPGRCARSTTRAGSSRSAARSTWRAVRRATR